MSNVKMRSRGIYGIFAISISFQSIYENREIANILHFEKNLLYLRMSLYHLVRFEDPLFLIHQIFSSVRTFGLAYPDLCLHSISRRQGYFGQITFTSHDKTNQFRETNSIETYHTGFLSM